MLTISPHSQHVLSADTVHQEVDSQGRLRIDRLIRKRGKLPAFIRPFLGSVSESWVLETSIVDPHNLELKSWARNLDHTRFLRVDDISIYTSPSASAMSTKVHHQVLFTSNLNTFLRDRIEQWSYRQFKARAASSREGMSFVMQQLREKGIKAYLQMDLSRFIVPSGESSMYD